MCTDGDKSEETKTPKSRHELNTGRLQPFILTGLHIVLLPICIEQHLLMDMGSCHVSAHDVMHTADSYSLQFRLKNILKMHNTSSSYQTSTAKSVTLTLLLASGLTENTFVN